MGAASGKDVPAASPSATTSGSMELNNWATITQGLSAKEEDIMSTAYTNFALVHCKQEAIAFAACRNEKSAVPEQQCKREVQALNACAQRAAENGHIQGDLIKVGVSQGCRADFDALAECKKRGGACDADERRFFVCSAAAFNVLMRKMAQDAQQQSGE